ncbi:MAG: hypothetical protein Fues2KO_10500 [Fuerstiella sp.]
MTRTAFSGYDFFTNFGEYMPRIHCLRTADGTPDWPWIIGLITLQSLVVAGYARIFRFWQQCYYDEAPADRNDKLMDLAWVFALCAVCGYGLSVIIFVWPVYRLQALALVGLVAVTWRFAGNLEPFRQSFKAHRLERELNESLSRENSILDERNAILKEASERNEEIAAALRVANRELDEFVYAASHDLKSPLRAIDSLSEFVLDDAGDQLPEASREDLHELRRRVSRMSRMLDGLLNYSRNRRCDADVEGFTSSDAVREAVEVLSIPGHIRVSQPDSPIDMFSQRPPLEQVLRNLVDNAVKHHDKSAGVVEIRTELHNSVVQFEIYDDGPGIPPEYHDQVFGMFQTLKRRDEFDSNGMGLALVKRIVESHGGTIELESDGQSGTVFRFTWPIISDRSPGSVQPESSRTEEQQQPLQSPVASFLR